MAKRGWSRLHSSLKDLAWVALVCLLAAGVVCLLLWQRSRRLQVHYQGHADTWQELKEKLAGKATTHQRIPQRATDIDYWVAPYAGDHLVSFRLSEEDFREWMASIDAEPVKISREGQTRTTETYRDGQFEFVSPKVGWWHWTRRREASGPPAKRILYSPERERVYYSDFYF